MDDLQNKIKQLETLLENKEKQIALFKEQCAKLTIQVKQLSENTQNYIKNIENLYNRIVPTNLPHLKGFKMSVKFEPGEIFSSAYYDFFKIDRSKMGVFLSVSSNSSVCASVMKIVLSSIDDKTLLGDPKAFLTHFISHSNLTLKPYENLDLFYGVLDRSQMNLSYAHWGDITGVHLQPEGLSLLKSDQSSLSDKNRPEVFVKELKLTPKDHFVLLTDNLSHLTQGVKESEVKNQLQHISTSAKGVHEVKNKILFELKELSGHKPIQKDLAVLVFNLEPYFFKLIQFPSIQKKT